MDELTLGRLKRLDAEMAGFYVPEVFWAIRDRLIAIEERAATWPNAKAIMARCDEAQRKEAALDVGGGPRIVSLRGTVEQEIRDLILAASLRELRLRKETEDAFAAGFRLAVEAVEVSEHDGWVRTNPRIDTRAADRSFAEAKTARALAAAAPGPEMYAALEFFADERIDLTNSACHVGLCSITDCGRCSKIIAARLALAKARGEQ